MANLMGSDHDHEGNEAKEIVLQVLRHGGWMQLLVMLRGAWQ